MVLLVGSPAAQAQEPRCDITADRWEQEGDAARLFELRAICDGIELEAASGLLTHDGFFAEDDNLLVVTPEGQLRTSEVRFENGALTADSACLYAEPDRRVRCCGADVRRTNEGQWTLDEATCQIEGGIAFRAQQVRMTGDEITLLNAGSVRPIALPLRVRHLDTSGRSSGFVAPVLGYRTDRGGGARIEWYQPFNEAVELSLGVFGETVGAVGVVPSFRWSQSERSDSELSTMFVYDASSERAFRSVLHANATLRAGSALGLTIVGDIASDTQAGMDFGLDSTSRQRPDYHLSAAGWAGGRFDRFWMGVYERQIVPVEAAGSDRAVAPDFYGSTPAVGYVVSAPIGRWGSIGADLRFDRFIAPGADSGSNELRMVVGGTLRALSWSALSVFPGLWMTVAAAFDDPSSNSETYRRYGTLLQATLDIESPWIGGGPNVWHLVTFRARGVIDAYEAEGGEGQPTEAQPVFPNLAPYRFDIGVDQTVRSDAVQLHLPVNWLAHVDDGLIVSRLLATLRLVVGSGDWRWELTQLADVDLDAKQFCCWTGGTALRWRRSRETAPNDLGRSEPGFGFGGSVTLIRSDTSLLPGLEVFLPPLIRQTGATLDPDGDRVGRGWLNVDFGPAGLSAQVAWYLEFSNRPDITGALWVGRAQQLRLLLTGAYLTDRTAIVQLSLAHGTFQPWGAWGSRY